MSNKVKGLFFPLLNTLLCSKESEGKAGGLNVLGSFCGLGYDFKQSPTPLSSSLAFFRKNSSALSIALWQQVFDLQEDWDVTIREAAVVLV